MVKKPLCYMGYDVTSISDPVLGEFHYAKDAGYIDWTSADRLDSLSVTLDQFKLFMKQVFEICDILGIDLSEEPETETEPEPDFWSDEFGGLDDV